MEIFRYWGWVGQPFPESLRWLAVHPGLTHLAWKPHQEATLGPGVGVWLGSESKGGKGEAGSKVDKNRQLLCLCPPGDDGAVPQAGKGIPSSECQSLGAHQHPSQETGCNSLGLNLCANAKKGKEKPATHQSHFQIPSLQPRHINN